jgi:hypothetical protein
VDDLIHKRIKLPSPPSRKAKFKGNELTEEESERLKRLYIIDQDSLFSLVRQSTPDFDQKFSEYLDHQGWFERVAKHFGNGKKERA